MTEISNVRIEDVKFPFKDTIARNKVLDLKNEVESYSTMLPLNKYKDMYDGDDITKALRYAINNCEDGTTIMLDGNQKYVISDVGADAEVVFNLNKPVKIDFNNSLITLKVSGKIVFDLTYTGSYEFVNRVELKNYFFRTMVDYKPTSVIRVNGTINSKLSGSMAGCTVTHSLIHNYKGYGTRIKGELRYNNGSCAIYLSHSNQSIHSFDYDIDVDITGHGGTGIITEGGAGRIRGVIESCTKGGYNYNGLSICHGVTVSCHFEANKMYDMSIGSGIDGQSGTRNTGITNIIGSYFSPSLAPEKSIIFGRTQVINIVGSWLSKPLKPGEGSYGDTNIVACGNFQKFAELEEQYVGDRNIGFSSYNSKNTKMKDVTANQIDVETLYAKNAIRASGIVTDGRFRLTNSINNKEILATETAILPADIIYDLGGTYNRFNAIHASELVLTSSDGNRWRMKLNNNGQPVFTAL